MTLPVSKYEELLETVRNLKQQTIRVRELASPLLDTIISANTGETSTSTVTTTTTSSSSSNFFPFNYRESQDENKDAPLNYSLYEQNDYYYLNQVRSLSAMDSLLMEQRQQFDAIADEDGTTATHVSRRSSSSSSSCEPRDKYHHHHSHQFHHLDQHQHHTDNMWHSEPSPLNLNLLKRQNQHQHQHQQLSPHESVSPTDMNSVMSFASSSGAPVPFGMCLTSNEMMSSGGGGGGGGECEEARQRQQQLDVKVEMVYSLLAVLGTSECPDMGETLLALSSSPDSCRAMRQAGCLSILVQLVHAKDDENGKTREKAAQALRNLVQGQTDEKQKKRELKILKLLEDIRTHCNCYFSMDVDSNVSDVQTEVSKDENQKDKDQHPTQATENIIKLSFDEGYRHTICELGGIFTLARLIEIEHSRHGSLPTSEKCVTLRRYAGMALTNLTFGHGRNKSLLCSFNVFMKCLVTQLSSTTDELRQVTASVLRNLSWRADGASRAALRDAGAVTALMHAAMKSRREATLKSVLSALWNLSAHCSTNKADICAVPGALAFLVDMLGYRPPTGAGTLTIIENAGGILRNVSSHIAIRDDYRAILRDKGCLPLLLQQLKSPSLTVVSNACGTLWNLSAKCEQDQRALWDMGAAPMLRSLNHSKHAMIATGSRAALKNLLSSRPAHNLFNHMDATAREMGLPTLPTLGARKQRALAKDLDQNLSETCDNIEPTSPPQLLSPISSQLSMVTSNTTIMTTATTTTSTTQQLVESFASLNLTKVDDINIDNIPSSSIRSKLTDYHFDYNRQQDDNDLDLDLHLDLDDDNHEQPINYSEKYMENQIKPNKSIENLKKNTEATTSNTNKNRNNRNYSDYAETDLDQPTNYSLRYAENDSDSDIIQDEELFDTVKTYCTEGTPLNFSTATSMSDLRQIDAIAIEDKHKKDKDKEKKQQIQAPKYRQSKETVMRKIRGECQSSGLMTPEKPVKYCEEGTPRSFSRHSSFSSLNIDDKQNTTVPGTNDDEQVGVEEDKTTTTPPEKVENSVSTVAVAVATSTAAVTTPTIAIAAAAAAAAAATTATTGAEETPLMFSRCSSLCSLSSAEQHSIHDDRSSIISDFSRLTSGIVSPSELPDSPTQTVPPSPRQRRAPVDFTTQSKPQLHQQQPPMNQQQHQHQHQPLKSVFEDNVIKFKQANTPIEFSANTSLSSLTIDDDPPSNINFNILTGIVLGATPTDININMDKTAKSQSTSQMAVTNTNTNATASTAKQTTPLTLTLTINNQNDVDEQEEDDMLAACINIGIQNNRHREKKQSKQPSAKLPIRIQTHSNTSRSNIPTEVDSTRVYCTEDTPAMLSHAGSQSDLSLLSVESSAVNHRKCSENVNVNVLDLSDDSSNLSGDNESNILAECIQSGMPKAKTQQPRVAAIAAIAARDETSTYAVEDSPCQFSLRSSLSDLTIDGIKINNSSSSSKKIQPQSQPQPQLQLQIESRAESLSSLSVESFGSTENAEQALLEQCISSGMPPKNKPNTNTSLNSLEIESASSSKNGQAPSVTWTNRVTGENDDINIKNEYVNMTTINTNTNTNTTKNTLIENFTSWPQHEHETKQENNIINTEIIVKNNLDTVDKCSDLLDGSIEDNCYEHKTNELEVENNRMLDPDAMIESLDRFTAELVSQSSHLQQSYGNGNGNGNDTWNEDTSPNDISFPSISVSAPLVASFNSESDKLSKHEHEHEQELASFDTTSTMTESTLIAIEAANIVNTVRNEGLEMQESITSLDLEHMKPPSVMDSLVSLTSSLSINEPLPLAPKTNSPLAARKRSLPISNLMMRRALNNVNVNVNKNSNENLHQIHDSISSSSCSNLDYCKPPSVMGDFLDLVDMENSMISVASITSETIGDQEDGGHMYVTAAVEPCDCDSTADLITDNVFQDCLTHQAHDDVTITEYSDANSVTPIQSDFASSSAESTPKKERTICMRMTPKQRRQYAKDRYKTYTVAAEMCIKQQVVQTEMEMETETETISSNEKQNRLTPKERRQLDRERFQTRVLDVELIQKQIEQQTQTILNGTLETAEDDLHVVLAQQANIVLDTLHADELLDCETLSLVSNDDESELNSVSSINYRTYHKSWGLTKNNLPIVIHQQKQQDQQNTIDEQTVNSNKTPKIPKIVKPNDITITNSGSGSGNCNESTFQEDQQEEKEEIVKAVRGRRKPLYSSASSATSIRNKKPTTISSTTTTATPIKTTPLKSNIKQPFRTMTSNLVKNVTTTIKATTRNNTKATIANKPPIAVAKFNVVRSNTTIQQQQQQQQQQQKQIDTKKPELLKNRSSSNGSIPLNSKPLERQGTFTKDNTTTTKKTATNSNSKIPESKIPTQKFRTSAIQNRTVSSTTATTTTAVAASKITNRSPSTDRSSSSDFGFRNRRSPNTQIHQSNSTQSLQNGTNCTNDLAVKRSSNPDITDATPKRKPVASRIASLWKKSHSDVGVSMGAKKTTTTTTTNQTGAVKMRVKKTTTNSNSADQTKRISRLGSFIKVDEISVT